MSWLARPGASDIAGLLFLISVGCSCEEGRRSAPGEPPLQAHSARQVGTMTGKGVSCSELSATCGASGNEDCCSSLLVPGGTFSRSYDGVDYLDPKSVATLGDFCLDRYEVTVARFRAFLKAGLGTRASPPKDGAGAHPKIPGSGWRTVWNEHLPANTSAAKLALGCFVGQSWTDSAGNNENKPINCLDWYSAFAFCAWDGGRLPTEAEWNYAASGGSEHRYYPWSQPARSTTIDDTFAVYCGGSCNLENVGSRSPKGDGKWGQSDLGGNAWEWTLDWDTVTYPLPCRDCATVGEGTYRAFRSGSNDELAPTLRSATRHVYYPEHRGNIGARCARSAPLRSSPNSQ